MKAMYYICNTCTVAKRGEEYTNVIITSVCESKAFYGLTLVNKYDYLIEYQ